MNVKSIMLKDDDVDQRLREEYNVVRKHQTLAPSCQALANRISSDFCAFPLVAYWWSSA